MAGYTYINTAQHINYNNEHHDFFCAAGAGVFSSLALPEVGAGADVAPGYKDVKIKN